MGGSAAETPATPEYLRASDEERDRAISALRQEFVEGRLSHETFMFRVQSALGAQRRGQLVGLFTDLPPRRPRFLDRIRATFGWAWGRKYRRQDRNPDDAAADWHPGPRASPGMRESSGVADAAGWRAPPAPWTGVQSGSGDPARPAPMVFPPGSGTSFTIGRTQDCDLRIADLSVSRRHAQLERGEDGWLLSDLGSHNGTRVNGWLVRESVPVKSGDVLQFGSATFVIRDPGGDEGRTVPRERGVVPPG